MTDSRTVVAVVVAVGTLPMAAATLGAGSASAISLGDSVSGAQDGTISAAPGDTVTVKVWANATEVRGYQANLTFDPSVVVVTTVSGSSDFDDPVATVNNDTGWVAFNQLRSTETEDPVLAEITVRLSENASSSTQLAFVESATKISDSDGETVSPESYNGMELAVENSSSTPTPTPAPTDTPIPTPTETPTVTPTPTPTETPTVTPTPTPTETPTVTPTPAPTETPTVTPTPTPTETSDGTSTEVSDDTGSNGGGSTNNDNDSGDSSGGGAISPPEPSFSIVATSLNRSSVAPGDPVTVSGTVENTGDDGTFAGRVYSNGTSMGASTTVEIPEREQRQVSVTVRFDSPGVHAVRLNSVAAGNVTVRLPNETTNGTTNATPKPTATATDSGDSETPVPRVRTTTGGSGPGFGAAALAVSLSLLLGWLGYRQEGAD